MPDTPIRRSGKSANWEWVDDVHAEPDSGQRMGVVPDSIRYVHKICFSLSNDIEAH
jgi:hypothetical protein